MFSRKKTAFFGTMALTLVVGFMIAQVSKADTPANPGSGDDPIVTKSYVDSKIAELTGGTMPPSGGQPSGSTGYTVLQLKAGQSVKASTAAGLELIVRSGNVSAIQGTQGGLSDVTTGTDLTNGAAIALNHLLVLARNDGRGIKINASGVDAYVMVRGAYTLQ
jgi:hypothetical protein